MAALRAMDPASGGQDTIPSHTRCWARRGGYVEGDRRPRLPHRAGERASRGHPGPAEGVNKSGRPAYIEFILSSSAASTRLWPVGWTERGVKRCAEAERT